MFSQLSSVARSGMIALIALSMTPTVVPAAPVGPIVAPAVADSSAMKPIQVRDGRGIYRYSGVHDWRRRYYRGPYRSHVGPGVVLGLGLLGAAIANSAIPYRPRYVASPHVEWCYARYRSYRASDNTYQPYNGPRRQCISPYL